MDQDIKKSGTHSKAKKSRTVSNGTPKKVKAVQYQPEAKEREDDSEPKMGID